MFINIRNHPKSRTFGACPDDPEDVKSVRNTRPNQHAKKRENGRRVAQKNLQHQEDAKWEKWRQEVKLARGCH